jgi:hypothetical protein
MRYDELTFTVEMSHGRLGVACALGGVFWHDLLDGSDIFAI